MDHRRFEIKICGMRDPQNIREVLSLPVDYIGLIFYPKSPRFVANLDPVAVAKTEIRKVGVFVNSSTSVIQQAIDRYTLDIIQLHGEESADVCAYWSSRGVPVWKAFGVHSSFCFSELKAYADVVDRFVFDTKSGAYGGTGVPFEWSLLTRYEEHNPYFLSGGIGPENIADALQVSDDRMLGFDMNSKLESAPGLKNITLVRNALKKIHHE